jgi:hypothetical protein
MKKHNKITAPERDQIAWWLAGEVTIREMARLLKGTQLPDTLEVFAAYIRKVFGLFLNLGRRLSQKGTFLIHVL